jgi:hypothetical protein
MVWNVVCSGIAQSVRQKKKSKLVIHDSRKRRIHVARSLLTCIATLAVSALPMFGSAILVDGTYHEFAFGLAPYTVIGCDTDCTNSTNPVSEQGSTSPWTFSGAAVLFVIDVGHQGDRFQAFDNNVSLGLTTDVGNPPNVSPCGFDIGCAIADSGYSRGTFALGSGDHSITLDLIQNAGTTIGGNAFFSVGPSAAGVPEPGTFGLLGLGFAACAVARFRRRKTS